MLQIERIGDKVRFRRIEAVKKTRFCECLRFFGKVRFKKQQPETWLIACEEYSERKTLWRT